MTTENIFLKAAHNYEKTINRLVTDNENLAVAKKSVNKEEIAFFLRRSLSGGILMKPYDFPLNYKCEPEFTWVKVSEEIFDLYINYLLTRKEYFYRQATLKLGE